jgi:hypothetical protein
MQNLTSGRNLTSGVVGILFGGWILINWARNGGPQGQGAYLAGEVVGLIFGVLLFGGGWYYLIKGIRELSQPMRKGKEQPPAGDQK